MADKIQTTWMWHDEATGGTMGAILDLDDREIAWIDQPGCACGDNSQPQSFEDFLSNGAITHVPQDILDEMQIELRRFMAQPAEH